MPKQTFFNLPQEKQKILVQAAKKEFSRVPLNDASIANIIKDAGIPRGSFYQYFEDKEDMFYYILEEHMKMHNREFTATLKKNKGDLFDSFTAIFKNVLIEFQNQENIDFYRNVFLNLNYEMENKIAHGFRKSNFEEQFAEIITDIDADKLNVTNDEEVAHVFKIIIAVTNNNLMRSFANEMSYEESLASYKFELELLKKGLSKQNE